MRRGVDQPTPPPLCCPSPSRRIARLVVMQWVDGAINFAVVCEFLDPWGRPGPHLTGIVMLLLELAGPGLAPAVSWLWVHGGDWFCDWLRVGLWVWLWGAGHPCLSLPLSDSTLRLAPGATNSAIMPS